MWRARIPIRLGINMPADGLPEGEITSPQLQDALVIYKLVATYWHKYVTTEPPKPPSVLKTD